MEQGPEPTNVLKPLVPQTSSYRAMLEAIRKSGYQHRDGDHLSSDGPYVETVERMCLRNPCLRWGHIEYTATPGEYGKGTILELRGPSPLHTVRRDFKTSRELYTFLHAGNATTNRRIIILEGVSRNYVEVLGSHFNMNPSFFASQKRPNSWHLVQECVERTANLPTLNKPSNSFMIRYPELRYFLLKKDGCTQLDDKYIKDLDGLRRVDIFKRTRQMDKLKDHKVGAFNNVGAIGRAASYWSRKYSDGGWDAIILTDPPVTRLVKTTPLGVIVDGIELDHTLYRGGYQDFIPYPEGLEESRRFIASNSTGPSRVSMLEDLCFYFMQHSEQLDGLGDGPDIATVFLKKIAASNWLFLADYFNACAHNLEHHFSRNDSFDVFTIPTIERWWGDLHLWHRRCVQHCEEVNAILTALRIPQDYMPRDQYGDHPMDCREDFASIYRRLLWTKSRFELLVSSATGLNAIAGNKEAMIQNNRYSLRAREESNHSLLEARKASVLTFLATVFVPFAITSGIFSMTSEWAPGGDKFVYYWVITLPLVLLLGIVYYIIARASEVRSKAQEGNILWENSDVEKGMTKRD